MGRGLSLYLELMRALAALAVLLGHMRLYADPDIPAILGNHHQEAVAFFFVLSGFVIRFVTVEREASWRSYVAARAARLYSVVPLAILVTLVCDAATLALAPQILADRYYFDGPGDLPDVLSSMIFANELWLSHVVLGSNIPFWSLGFEVCYYIFFGLALYLDGRARWLALAAWALICGPKIILYLPLWMLGVGAYELLYRYRLLSGRRTVGMILFGGSALAYLILKYGLFAGAEYGIFHVRDGDQMLRTWTYFHGIGLCAAMNIVGFALLFGKRAALLQWCRRPIKWLSGASFTLYLMHLPVLFLLMAIVPDGGQGIAGLLIIFAGTIGIVLLLAELGERRKHVYAAALGAILPRARRRAAG
ncbi:acyltransferase family protein [Sphingomonas oleivorans]|nr:acyltransferase family protein [Sphingomonas oleivorans]